MKAFKSDILDTEFDILKTHILDPDGWLLNFVNEEIRFCTDRIFEETTGMVSKNKSVAEKITALSDYKLTARTEADSSPILKHEKKGV